VRRRLAPAPQRAVEALGRIGPADGRLRPALAAELTRIAGVPVDPSMWDGLDLPPHLRPRFRVVADGATVAEGDDLAELERRLRPRVRSTLVSRTPGLERDGLTSWTIGSLPPVVESTEGDGPRARGFPALIDTRDSVGVRVLADRSEQRALHWDGVRRLLALQLPRPARTMQRLLDAGVLLRLATAPHGSVTAAVDDALDAVLDSIILEEGGPVRDGEAFDELLAAVRARYVDRLASTVEVMADSVHRSGHLREKLRRSWPEPWSPALEDMSKQVDRLVFDGMAVAIGADRMIHVPRYLQAVDLRLEKLRDGVAADTERMVAVRRLEAEHAVLVSRRGLTAALDDVRWAIEELRVQQFAQQLGTAETVSGPRIRRALERIRTG
jgi:ATP-dependent helicase HrpA